MNPYNCKRFLEFVDDYNYVPLGEIDPILLPFDVETLFLLLNETEIATAKLRFGLGEATTEGLSFKDIGEILEKSPKHLQYTVMRRIREKIASSDEWLLIQHAYLSRNAASASRSRVAAIRECINCNIILNLDGRYGYFDRKGNGACD